MDFYFPFAILCPLNRRNNLILLRYYPLLFLTMKGNIMVVIDGIAIFYAVTALTAGSMFVYHNSGARKH
jgi:hypothetical protein